MKNTIKKFSILASAFLMAVTGCFLSVNASAANSVDLTDGYASETIHLSDAEVIAGNKVMVQLSLNTNNQCAAYNLDIEFDSSLTLIDVNGATTWCVIGNVATIIGFTANYFEDGNNIATLIFETPESAFEGAEYNVIVADSELTCKNENVIVNAEVKNSTVEVVESAKAVTNYITIDESSLGLRGDANDDGVIDVLDAVKIAKYMIGNDKLSVKGTCQADVNGNNSIDIQDAIAISKYMISSDKSNAWEAILK